MQETYNLHQEFITRVNGTYKINLKCSRIHLASRGFKDSIGDIEYEEGNIRIGESKWCSCKSVYRIDLALMDDILAVW